jgi:Cu-Zn family superoxide dismutase
MRLRALLALSGIAATAACASSSTRPASPQPAVAAQAPAPGGTPAAGATWQGEIRPESGTSVAGSVMLAPAATAGQSSATVTLTGAPANGTHPWHVHSGTCAEKGPVVGAPTAYPPLTADSTGAARTEATLPFATPTSGSYSVNVHMSPTQMGMIVGCADLRAQ